MDEIQKTKNEEKGEAMLTAFGVIKKIGVYCYDVKVYDRDDSDHDEKLIIIGNNEEKIKERTKDGEIYSDLYYYTLERSFEISSSEVMERFDLDKLDVDRILGGENISSTCPGFFRDCGLSIEELREKRKIASEKFDSDKKIDSEPFDSDDIISKIASEYALTPKRKEALIRSIHELQ